jgi:aspartyl-tRNA(Asn)/glutamyl-tRNA(Gln) amidotransferase subunit C
VHPHIINDSQGRKAAGMPTPSEPPQMSLSPENIKQVAHLARLELPADRIGPYAGQLSNIMQLVDQLSGANTEGVTPMAHPLAMQQRLRPDTVTESDRREAFQAIAPAVDDGVYLVPKVIE